MFAAQTGLGFVNPVTIAGRRHLYPSRTQKLSSPALRILGGRLPGKVGRCRFFWPYGQAVKTPPFHGGNPGSIPGRVTIRTPDSFSQVFFHDLEEICVLPFSGGHSII